MDLTEGSTRTGADGELALVPIPLPDGSDGQVRRQELVRVIAAGLRDLGYPDAASALEKESKITSSSSSASAFLQLLADKQYDEALGLLDQLPFRDGARGKRRAKGLIIQERYVDCLANNRLDEALKRLQEEVYFLPHFDGEGGSDVDELAALLACPTFQDLSRVSGMLRARQAKRFRQSNQEEKDDEAAGVASVTGETTTLIDCIRDLLDPEAVVPPLRLHQLLGQAFAHQWSDGGEHASGSGQSRNPLRTHSYRRFDAAEPMPLLREIREVEDQRNVTYTPSSTCRHVVSLVDEGARSQLMEIWCLCFHPFMNMFVAGTSDGTIVAFEIDLDSMQMRERGRVKLIFGKEAHGRPRPIASVDWVAGSSPEDLGKLLCVSKTQPPPISRRSRGSSAGSSNSNNDIQGDEEEEEEEEMMNSEEEEEGSGDEETASSAALVRILYVRDLVGSSKEAEGADFPHPGDVHHMGRPCAKWLSAHSLTTAGIDGWYRTWRLVEDGGTYDSSRDPAALRRIHHVASVQVERTVDMAVVRSSSSILVLLACVDAHIHVLDGASRPIYRIPTGGMCISLAVGFNSVAATIDSQTLLVWNVHDLRAAKPSTVFAVPPLTFRGYVNKRFILRPGIGMGDIVAMGSEDGSVHVWSTTGNLTREAVVLQGHSLPVNAVRFSLVEPGLAVTCGDDATIRLWSRRMHMDQSGIRL